MIFSAIEKLLRHQDGVIHHRDPDRRSAVPHWLRSAFSAMPHNFIYGVVIARMFFYGDQLRYARLAI
jgi:hypothetical protein